MRLGDLTSGLDLSPDDAAIEITGLTSDSRSVKDGYLFAALSGRTTDGARFICDALAAGARAVLTAGNPPVPAGIAVVKAADPRRAFALAAARFFPRQPEIMVAVTGTSGKTSVAEFTRQIFKLTGHAAASIGTIGVTSPEGSDAGGLTTPDPVLLHRQLAALADTGVTHAAIEASSHGLDQRRLDGIRLRATAFTNLGRDHLDYHASVEHYFGAKLRLFTQLLPADGTAIVTPDEPYADRVMRAVGDRGAQLISVGRRGEHIRLAEAERSGFEQVVNLEFQGQATTFRFPLIGEFQLANALTAAGLALASGIARGDILEALPQLTGVPGRLQVIGPRDAGSLTVVDYAHKPDALRNVLAALRPYAVNRLIVVIGAGGDRDRGKRTLMGEAAQALADVVIITDDNPRSEDPAAIRKALLEGAPGGREIGDRRSAIRAGLDMLATGDVLCVAGKGHETGQVVGDVVQPFSDAREVRAWQAEAGL
jgi:UDP-N-acetylmuramoyl-L-alanyl-D-glutamate--2,6-diaminopimelate ligase